MKKIIIPIILLFCFLNLNAQSFYGLSTSFNSEAIGFPFTNYSPVHPGVEIASNFLLKDKSHSIRFLNLKLGFYHHRRIENAFYLGSEYQHTLKALRKKLGIDLNCGIGYMHLFYPSEIYEQDGNGNFKVVNQFGKPRFYANVSVGVSYIGWVKIVPYLKQEFLLQTPFSGATSILPHSIVKIGIQVKLKTK